MLIVQRQERGQAEALRTTLHNLIYLAALAGAGIAFSTAVSRAIEAPGREMSLLPAAETEAVSSQTAQDDPSLLGDRPWPELFGKLETTQVPGQPNPPPTPLPNFALRGLVTSGVAHWAIVSSGDDDLLVREGDVLDGGWTVDAIHTFGVTLVLEDRRELIVFDDDLPLRTVAVNQSDLPDTENPNPPQSIRTPVASPTELSDMIKRAEMQRQALGLSPLGAATR